MAGDAVIASTIKTPFVRIAEDLGIRDSFCWTRVEAQRTEDHMLHKTKATGTRTKSERRSCTENNAAMAIYAREIIGGTHAESMEEHELSRTEIVA